MIAEIIISSLILAGLYILLSVGFSLIFGVAQILNFAHGALYLISAYLIYSLLPLGYGITIIIVLIAAPLLGMAIYSSVKNGFGLLTFLPLVLVPIAAKNKTKNKELEKHIQESDLKYEIAESCQICNEINSQDNKNETNNNILPFSGIFSL